MQQGYSAERMVVWVSLHGKSKLQRQDPMMPCKTVVTGVLAQLSFGVTCMRHVVVCLSVSISTVTHGL